MRVYVDSSALIKRVIVEPESDIFVDFLDAHFQQSDLLVSSSLAWIEVSRAILGRLGSPAEAGELIDQALSGIDERPITDDVVSVARRLEPTVLRSLGAIHLASAVLVDADLVVTYDARLAGASRRNALTVVAPGRAGGGEKLSAGSDRMPV